MRGAAALLLALWPAPALAHGMGNSQGTELVLDWMLAAVSAPVAAILLVSFALLAGTSGMGRARMAIGFLGLGLLMGIAASAGLGSYGAVGGLIIAALCSLMSAAQRGTAPVGVLAVAGLASGLAASVYTLDGHLVVDLGFGALLGVVLGPLVLAGVVAGWVAVILQASGQGWVRILFRILSSWCFAAAVIYLAFTLKPGA